MAKAKSVDYIVSAKDYDKSKGGSGSGKAWLLRCVADVRKARGIKLEVKALDAPSGKPVVARIEQGAWLADCECGGAMFIDPDEPVFFCCNCGNRANAGKARPVTVPDAETRAEIERLLLERPVNDMAGLNDLERAGLARPLIVTERGGLARNWTPDETLDELRRQNEPVEIWRSKQRKRRK